MTDARRAPLSDAEVDRLISRLETTASPSDPFAGRLLAVLEPEVRRARRRDRTSFGRWVSDLSASMNTARRSVAASPKPLQLAALLATLLLAGALAWAGAQRNRIPASQFGFRLLPVPIAYQQTSQTTLAALLPDGRVIVVRGASVDLFDPVGQTYARVDGAADDVGGLIRAEAIAVLHDGHVLFQGIVSDGSQGAVLFDPAAGAYEPGPAISADAPRDFSATTLANGRVMDAGGYSLTTLPNSEHVEQTFASAFVFDPVTTSFTRTGSLATSRYHHTATLLQDGRVLIAGGEHATTGTQVDVLASAELFDPKTGLFTPTGSMPEPRSSATAALLPDGRVLVVGGGLEDPDPEVPSAFLYDPSTGTWSTTGSPHVARFALSSVVLRDGRVLVVGSSVLGITSPPQVTPDTSHDLDAELYDPDTATFSLTGHTSIPLHDASLVLLPNGEVFVTSPQDSVRTGVGPDELFGPRP